MKFVESSGEQNENLAQFAGVLVFGISAHAGAPESNVYVQLAKRRFRRWSTSPP